MATLEVLSSRSGNPTVANDENPTIVVRKSTICNISHCEVHHDGMATGVPDAVDDAAVSWHLHDTEVQRVFWNIQIHGLKNCCIQLLHLSFCDLVTNSINEKVAYVSCFHVSSHCHKRIKTHCEVVSHKLRGFVIGWLYNNVKCHMSRAVFAV